MIDTLPNDEQESSELTAQSRDIPYKLRPSSRRAPPLKDLDSDPDFFLALQLQAEFDAEAASQTKRRGVKRKRSVDSDSSAAPAAPT